MVCQAERLPIAIIGDTFILRPYYSISLLGIRQLTFWQVQLLSAVTVLIAGAIPNVGGVGPTEFAFTLLYSPYLGRTNAAAMVLYRMASYLFPFLVSIPFAFHFRRLIQNRKNID